MRIIYIFAAAVMLQACSTVGSLDRPESYYQDTTPRAPETLLNGTTLGDNDGKIHDLLNYRIQLPALNRVAILNLGPENSWRFYSRDFLQLNESLVELLIEQLRASDRVYDASFLPSLLISADKSLPALREAAARFQADLLLTYRSQCQSYQKYRFIRSDESRSYCTVEAVLIDVRSGIIVKSVVSTEDLAAVPAESDKSFSETVKKAELEAVAKALGNVAGEVVGFLGGVGRLGQ